jgi:AraC-like DNA-binding protein
MGQFPDDGDFHGALSCMVSPLGIEFARIDAGAHEISGTYPNQPSSIWLALLIEGEAELTDGERRFTIDPGDITYGPSGVAATLTFATDVHLLFIKVPQLALNQRLIAPLSLRVGHLPGQSGISRVFSSMLRSLAEDLDDITAEQLHPIELVLTEFLITCVTHTENISSDVSVLGGATKAKAAHLHRICQTIETLLSDPNLTPGRVAEEHGVSLRYLQKLFTLSGKTFSNYVRTRRLERCRTELVSPLYADLSITEICYRWGFNASAHFSRAFRAHYHMSPREYRRNNTSR